MVGHKLTPWLYSSELWLATLSKVGSSRSSSLSESLIMDLTSRSEGPGGGSREGEVSVAIAKSRFKKFSAPVHCVDCVAGSYDRAHTDDTDSYSYAHAGRLYPRLSYHICIPCTMCHIRHRPAAVATRYPIRRAMPYASRTVSGRPDTARKRARIRLSASPARPKPSAINWV